MIFSHHFHASWHALHQSFTFQWGGFIPLLAQKFKQLDLLMACDHLPLYPIPEVFSGVQVCDIYIAFPIKMGTI